MGSAFSSDLAREDHIIGERVSDISNMPSTSEDNSESQEFHDAIDEIDDREDRVKAKEAEMEEFRRQLQVKREQRRGILDRHKAEKKELESILDNERKAKLDAYESNKLLRELLIHNKIEIPEHLQSSKENSNITESIVNMQEEFEKLKSNNNKLRRDLADCNVALQGAYSDIADLHLQNTESIKQINALKEVVAVSKTMLGLRENQLDELKAKLSEIERSLADREANMLSADLRQEYERQLQNIRSLRTLYEERARLAEVTRQGLLRELEEQKVLKQAEINKVNDLSSKVQELETKVDELQETILNKNNQIYTCQDETRGLKVEMSAVNKLFSQVLLGYKNQKDLDKLVHRLEENHGILTHMAENENDSEASTALPKLLLEIVSQVDEGEENDEKRAVAVAGESFNEEKPEMESESFFNTSAEEIVHNLPKVWRVLIELLSHQTAPDDNDAEKVTTCYKTIETKTGPVQVPSVSQTYIRLKDLIVEKLGLVKEVNRMKQLNAHLETRLEEQERRLCLVTNELSKTWHVVGRLRRHHHQLHTHEKILKYELQQKRKLLNELKEELEYCREKWDQAREKNTQSEKDWTKLRAEFSSRNTKSSTSFNNSAESGYSDEKPSDESSESNDESEYVTESLIRSKKKVKKSFETIVDSSTDRNLAAEREDPASDMLDVADLPLDTQDSEDQHDICDSCNSESLLKSEKVCETEDEVGDIAHDSCTEDQSAADHSQGNSSNENKNTAEALSNSSGGSRTFLKNDPAAILKSISEQNERLAKKDKKLEKLEKSGAALLQQTQSTFKISDEINSTLDLILSRPSSSKFMEQEKQDKSKTNELKEGNKMQDLNKSEIVENLSTISGSEEIDENLDSLPDSNTNKSTCSSDTGTQDSTNNPGISEISVTDNPCSSSNTTTTVDFKAILQNIKKQNESLARKDERLQNLETGCSEVVNNFSKTLSTGTKMIEKLDKLHNSTCEKSIFSQNDSCNEKLKEQNVISDVPSASGVLTLTEVDSAVLENVKEENENLVIKDEKLKIFEPCSSQILKSINDSSNRSKELYGKLDMNSGCDNKSENITKESPNCSSRNSSEPSTSSEVDHEALFAARDLRLKRLEEQTKSLVCKVNKTTDKGIKIHYKLEELHNIYGSESSRAGTPSDNEERDKISDDKDNTNDEKSEENEEDGLG